MKLYILIGILQFLFYLVFFVLRSGKTFAFKEWFLMHYSLFYILSPALSYIKNQDTTYAMKIPAETYFPLTCLGLLSLHLGLMVFQRKKKRDILNQHDIGTIFLIHKKTIWGFLILGTISGILRIFISGELSFIFYLLGLLRYIGGFSLFLATKKYSYLFLASLIDIFSTITSGMYHDLLIYFIFSLLIIFYVKKVKLLGRIAFLLGGFLFVMLIQSIKFGYRENLSHSNENSTFLIFDIITKKIIDDEVLGEKNKTQSIDRFNQGWIFASTIENMDRTNDFQGFSLVSRYMESALLPRFLAPNKIESGDQEIFSRFSGRIINEETSMGLGVFADGYIAFGEFGVYLFCFCLGLIFSLVFYMADKWEKVSPFYIFFIIPILFYGVRPDCELQTVINHIVKSSILYGLIVWFTRNRFTLDSAENQRKLLHLNLMK